MSELVFVGVMAFLYAVGYWVGRYQREASVVFLLSLPRCKEDTEELDSALDNLANRGVITKDGAEKAKRRIAEGGAE